MPLIRPTYVGVEDIMSAYDSINSDNQYYYSVWHSTKEIAFQFVGEDASKARAYLRANLQAMADADNDNLLYLKFHPADKKGKYITKNTDVIGNTPICCVEPVEGSSVAGVSVERDRSGDTGYQMYKTRLMLEELPKTIDARVSAEIERRLLEAEDLEPEEVEDPTQRIVGIINGIAGNPVIMGLIGQVLNFIKPQAPPIRINGLMNEQNIQQETNPAPVGDQDAPAAEPVPVNEVILNDALGRLHQHCCIDTDLLLLADMADNDPATFAMLLGMLRKR